MGLLSFRLIFFFPHGAKHRAISIMGDTDQVTDILLPQARIAVFSQDSETISSAVLIQEDWRFARVDVLAQEGTVDTAIETYKTETSPDLLIIQTDSIDDEFTARLGDLSAHCEEDTAAIIVGPVNDVYLYRKLIEMGVSDYLVKPIKPEVLSDVIAKALIQRLGVTDSRLIAFIGSKGGVGTSSFAQMAAWMVSKTIGQKTLLMDGAGGWSSLSVGMGFDPSATLHEVSRAVDSANEDALARMITGMSDKLSIVASGSDSMLDAGVSGTQYEAILNNFMVKSPVVLVDLSSAEPALKKAVLTRAHHIIALTTPTVTSLRFCRSLLKEISDVRGGGADDISLIVNKTGLCKSQEVASADLAEAMEVVPDLSVPFSPSLFLKHETNIKGFLSDKDAAALVTGFLPILMKTVTVNTSALVDEKDKNAGILGGFLNKFTS